MRDGDATCHDVGASAPLTFSSRRRRPPALALTLAEHTAWPSPAPAAMATMDWLDPLTDYFAFMLAADVAPSTLRIYRLYLIRLADLSGLSPWQVTVDDLAAFLACRSWSPATRKVARSAVRSFFGWAQLTGRRPDNPTALLRAIRVPPGLPRPAPDDAVARALASASCPRDRLMVMLGCYAGLRRGEIAVVHTRDVAGGVLRVHGKGRRLRDVPLHPVLVDAIARMPRGYLFPGLVDGHLSADRVGRILKDLLGDGWTAHTLRHRFLSLAYLAERDVRAVQELAGHAKLDTTMVYTKVPDGALLRAVLAAGPAAA